MRLQNSVISILCISVLLPSISVGQDITAEMIRNNSKGGFSEAVQEFYSSRYGRSAWNDALVRGELSQLVEQAVEYGLKKGDYVLPVYEGNSANDSARQDIRFTETAIHLISDLHGGNRYPDFEYRGLDYQTDNKEIPRLLSAFLDQKNLSGLAARVQPSFPEYRNALGLLRYLNGISAKQGFHEPKIISSKAVISNKALVKRLIQLGFIDIPEENTNDSILRSAVIAAQRKFDLLADGKIRSTLIAALNIPIKERIAELTMLLNTIRWSVDLREKGISVFLNIPSGTLMVFENNETILSSKVITGKKTTPSPTLTSVIDKVILYPYWVVPYNIATKEILPRIKRDISYLDRYQYQVIDSRGRQKDPAKIPWQSLSGSYFPYTLRQATGCDNSLGLEKFDFQNPFSVYLHDTPAKELFEMNRRFFSHGCMRVEKPVELARLLLDNNRQAIDTLTEKGCLFNQKPISVPAEKKASLAVLYSTAWFDEKGEIFFHEDVYGKRERTK